MLCEVKQCVFWSFADGTSVGTDGEPFHWLKVTLAIDDHLMSFFVRSDDIAAVSNQVISLSRGELVNAQIQLYPAKKGFTALLTQLG